MPAKVVIPVAELQRLIDKHRGNISGISREVKHDWDTISKLIKESAQATRALHSAREARFDSVVESLYDMAIEDRNVTAAIFIAKADPVAKARGWGERTEVSGPGGSAVELEHKGQIGDYGSVERMAAVFAGLAAVGAIQLPGQSGGDDTKDD